MLSTNPSPNQLPHKFVHRKFSFASNLSMYLPNLFPMSLRVPSSKRIKSNHRKFNPHKNKSYLPFWVKIESPRGKTHTLRTHQVWSEVKNQIPSFLILEKKNKIPMNRCKNIYLTLNFGKLVFFYPCFNNIGDGPEIWELLDHSSFS